MLRLPTSRGQGTLLALLFCAVLAIVTPVSAVPMTQQYQQLLTSANSLAAMSLLYFDLDPRPGGAALKVEQQALQQAAQQLQHQAEQLGLMGAGVQGMLGHLDSLQRLAPRDTAGYPTPLVGMLDEYQRLQQQVLALQQQREIPVAAVSMNQQSQRIAQLRLHALARNARLLEHHSLISDSTFIQLDEEIEAGFVLAAGLLPAASAPQLSRQLQAYRFVRPKLLEPDTLRHSSAVERYINPLLQWLDQQAVVAEQGSVDALKVSRGG